MRTSVKGVAAVSSAERPCPDVCWFVSILARPEGRTPPLAMMKRCAGCRLAYAPAGTRYAGPCYSGYNSTGFPQTQVPFAPFRSPFFSDRGKVLPAATNFDCQQKESFSSYENAEKTAKGQERSVSTWTVAPLTRHVTEPCSSVR